VTEMVSKTRRGHAPRWGDCCMGGQDSAAGSLKKNLHGLQRRWKQTQKFTSQTGRKKESWEDWETEKSWDPSVVEWGRHMLLGRKGNRGGCNKANHGVADVKRLESKKGCGEGLGFKGEEKRRQGGNGPMMRSPAALGPGRGWVKRERRGAKL